MTLITHNGRNVLSNNPLASPLDVGSYSIVNEISQLNNLPTEKRKPGLLIHVLENNGFYVLKNRSYTFTISDWQSLSINSQEDKVFYDREVPLGLSDGVNKIFTLVHEPKFGSEHVYLNGLLQDPSGKNNDYTKIGRGRVGKFLLNYFPEENSEHVYLNGLLQDESQNADYVIYENKIIFNFPPLSDSKVKCSYRYL